MITFREFITEGGWSSTVTQDVIITPKVAKETLAILPRFERDFNSFLRDEELMPVQVGKAVGSTAYIERDLKDNPAKEYGDIDVVLHLPRLPDLTDAQVRTTYAKALKKFIAAGKHEYIYKQADNTGAYVIVKAPAGWVQVDLIQAVEELGDWLQHRVTPEHGLKGAVIGKLYAAIALVLKLSIGNYGVQAKEKGGTIVPFRELKVDKTHTISTDIGNFMLDIFKVFAERQGLKNAKPSASLKAHPGMNRNDIKIADLALACKGLGQSFEQNDMFGKGELKQFKDYADFIGQLKAQYEQRMLDATKATKFDKAETDSAKARAAEIKQILLTKSKEVIKLLD